MFSADTPLQNRGCMQWKTGNFIKKLVESVQKFQQMLQNYSFN